jgi:type III restriction enzyme
MSLTHYQERARREVGIFLQKLAEQQASGNAKYASLEAWDQACKEFKIQGTYNPRKNGLDKDLPNFCVRVPTGGGKTLLATQILGLIYDTILKDRNGAGLVLWVVPSDQIYKDTLKKLRDRADFHRESLEFAVSRRIEVWEKDEVFRITPSQMRSNLNILLLKLASTNRESKEQLKFFRDAGGNIMQHFPPEDEPEQHKELKARYSNLDMMAEDQANGEFLVTTSLGNLAKLYEPPVILDEGHKATSALARKTIEGFNASVIVELSATPPKGANILTRVSGRELLDEDMIKLPMNISNSNEKSWKDCLTQAKDKREELAKAAVKYYRETEKLIRPIVLVQVERTGKDQRDQKNIHSEDVKEHLIQRLGVPEAAIAIKTSEKDDIEGIDLLAEGCPIEWIITKAALQEGWDCPFAYILVSLNNTGSLTSMTQLVGRVLRQPFITKATGEDLQKLNESYVFCMKRRASDIANEVKKSLEKEGYEGDLMSVVDASDDSTKSKDTREAQMRDVYRRFYKKFEGKVYLPRFAVKEGKDYAALDYYGHLVSKVDVSKFDYASIKWDLSDLLAKAKDSIYRLTLNEDLQRVEEHEVVSSELDENIVSWLIASLSIDYFSFKQLREIVERVIERVLKVNPELTKKLSLVKFELRQRIAGFVERETDRVTHKTFDKLFNEKKLCFYLQCVDTRFEIPPKVDLRSKTKKLTHYDGDQIQQSLFDIVPDDLNEYEKAIALYLDTCPQVLWWYRNLVGPESFSIQGYKRPRIYPDFVVQEGEDKRPIASVLVVESKGKHLQGNPDTDYKRSIADYFSKLGHEVPWQKLAADFRDSTFRVQVLDEGEYGDRTWKDELKELLEAD